MGIGMILGIILAILLIGGVLWYVFGSYAGSPPATGGGQGGTNITVPREVDVNVNQGGGGGGGQ